MKNKTSLLKEIAKKRMMIALLMGFSSGVPLLLTSKTLQAWMVDVHVDLKIIGIFALVHVLCVIGTWKMFDLEV